jgi:hypothetical protein
MRVLYYGEGWLGSNARSCCESLRRLGHDVLEVDDNKFIPQAKSLTGRVIRRLLRPLSVRELNDAVLLAARNFHPDVFIAFKGTHVMAKTLRAMTGMGIPSYNYYPDTSAFGHGPWIPESLPHYDAVFYTKPFWYGDVSGRLRLKAAQFVPHGYDPELHRPMNLTEADRSQYGCDVSLIATRTPHKEKILAELVRIMPEIDLAIWGPRWDECKSPELRRHIKGYPLPGQSFVRAIQCSKINLAIMSGKVTGASSGDLTTSRTYIIPACGGFMLHERNDEVAGMFTEGREMAAFDSPSELAEKISHYLVQEDERKTIAADGHRRCVPAYSYDARMAEIIEWHESQIVAEHVQH